MFNTPAKMARENVARAGRDLLKGDMAKAVGFICDALKIMIESTIFGKEKFEVEVHLQEFLKEFNSHAEVKAYFTAKNVHTTPYVRFARGEERKLLAALSVVLGDLQQAEAETAEGAKQRQADEIRDALDQGQQLLDSKELPKAKAVLNRLVEKYPKEEGLKTDIGGRLLKAALYFEAGELLEQAIAENPKDSKALALAVQAYKSAREFTKMEALYKFALKTYGTHPKTLQHMAEMYFEWNKWDDAYNCAKQAYELDSSLDKAKEIMDTTGKRIFG
jgi:tetratricopeptide (TPR) repeat protein